MVIIETTFYLILIPDDDRGDDDVELSSQITLNGFHEESNYFGLSASVVCSHVVFMLFI